MQKTFNALFFTPALNTTIEKKSEHSALGHAYEEISYILRRRGRHIRKHLCGKDKSGGKDCARRQSLRKDRSNWNPQGRL